MSISTQASNMNGRVLNPPLSAAQQAAANGGPPPYDFTGTGIRINGVYSQVLPGGRTRPFVSAATPSSGSTFTVNGRVIATRATKKIKSDSGVRFPKSYRENLDDKAKLGFLKQMELKQQIPFSATTISVNDPSKLINHYSLSKTVSEFRRNMYKYGLHEVFTVVKPFDIDVPSAGQLKSDTN